MAKKNLTYEDMDKLCKKKIARMEQIVDIVTRANERIKNFGGEVTKLQGEVNELCDAMEQLPDSEIPETV